MERIAIRDVAEEKILIHRARLSVEINEKRFFEYHAIDVRKRRSRRCIGLDKNISPFQYAVAWDKAERIYQDHADQKALQNFPNNTEFIFNAAAVKFFGNVAKRGAWTSEQLNQLVCPIVPGK